MDHFSTLALSVFEEATAHYHITDHVDAPLQNPYPAADIRGLLYLKNWIDAVQWHLEDIIRNPVIDPVEALAIKRRIDKSNQDRTDLVERIDEYFYGQYKEVAITPQTPINTETPAWAIDRLSILVLKIWHMQEQCDRTDAPADHLSRCRNKWGILMAQKTDLSSAIDQLLADLAAGRKQMRLYKQMKMYNDPALNPVLYGKK